jgi:hypothetical protein
VLATRKSAPYEGWFEGSVVQTRGPTNRNRIRGSLRWTSVPANAKSGSTKTLGCRSGGRAAKVVGLTSGDLRRCPRLGLSEPQGGPIAAQKSAAGIVGDETSRHPRGRKPEASLISPKAQTVPGRTTVPGK